MSGDDTGTAPQGVAMHADTPRSRCVYYRNVCHLPTRVEPETGQITMRAGLVWAVMMPAGIGQLVKIDLDRRGHGGGPIISHLRAGIWTFLTRTAVPAAVVARDARLWNHRVTLPERGSEIGLPSPADRGVFHRAWIAPAHSGFRPTGERVAEAIRMVLYDTDAHAATETLLLPVVV